MSEKTTTLCWSCARPGTGGCSWDRKLEPVEGWNADRTQLLVGNKYIPNWNVNECPLYKEDRKVMVGPSAIVAQEMKDKILESLKRTGSAAQSARQLGLPCRVVQYHKDRFLRKGML